VYHSPFNSVAEVIDLVVRSFASFAPPDAELLVKNHPLDTGHDRHEQTLTKLAVELGIGRRVHFFESGNLPAIFKRVQGTIVVNSTVGLVALTYGCPVMALAAPIYKIRGLTFPGALDEFWEQPDPPDSGLARAFRDVVLATTQVNGIFFTPAGIRSAIQSCERMLTKESPLEALKRRVDGH
jgi:capsular polysaccharide export protein